MFLYIVFNHFNNAVNLMKQQGVSLKFFMHILYTSVQVKNENLLFHTLYNVTLNTACKLLIWKKNNCAKLNIILSQKTTVLAFILKEKGHFCIFKQGKNEGGWRC